MQKKRSAVWRHFAEEGENKVSCRKCHKRLTKHGNTSMMLRHLRGKHPELLPCMLDGHGAEGPSVPQVEEEPWQAEEQQQEDDIPSHDNSVKKKRSTVWRHFAEDGRDKVWCRLCNERLAKHGNTSSMLRHLRGKHPDLKLGDLQGEQTRRLNRLHLRSSNSETRFLSICERLLRHNQLTDCTLVADGHLVPAHRLVLATCSESFEEMFKSITQPNPVVVLRDISLNELQGLISYMYKGETLVKSHNLPGLLRAATQLKIKGLCQVGLNDPWVDDSQTPSLATPQPPQPQPTITKTDLPFYPPDDNDVDDDDDDIDNHNLQPATEETVHKKSDNTSLDLMTMCEELEDSTHSTGSNLGDRIKRVQIKLEQTELDQAAEECSDTEMQQLSNLDHHSGTHFLTEEEVVIQHEALDVAGGSASGEVVLHHPQTLAVEQGEASGRIGLRDPLAQAVKVATQCADPQGNVARLLETEHQQTAAAAAVQGAIEDGGLILLGLSGTEGSQEFPHPGPSHQSQGPSSPPPTTSSASPPSPDPLAMSHRPTPPRKARRYSKQDLATALNLIREGHIGIKPAARAFNIPVATLYNAAKRNDISSPMQQGANKDSSRSKIPPLLVSGEGGQPAYLCFSRANTSSSQ